VKTSTLVVASIVALPVIALAALDIAFYLKLPPILRGIARGYVFVWGTSPASVAFSQKLVATFPPGTKEDDLVQRLKAEGFVPGRNRYSCGLDKALRYSYTHIHSLFPWRWNVCWTSDQSGNVTEIGGRGGISK